MITATDRIVLLPDRDLVGLGSMDELAPATTQPRITASPPPATGLIRIRPAFPKNVIRHQATFPPSSFVPFSVPRFTKSDLVNAADHPGGDREDFKDQIAVLVMSAPPAGYSYE